MGIIYKAIDHWNSPSLAHHGVKGMKWGVRKEYERKLKRSEKEYLKNKEKSLKYIRKANNRIRDLVRDGNMEIVSTDRKSYRDMRKAIKYSDRAEKNEAETWKIIGDVVKKGGSVKIKQGFQRGPTAKMATFLGGGIAGAYYSKSMAYAESILNEQGETPMYMISNKYIVKGRGGKVKTSASHSPLQWYRRRQFNAMSSRNKYAE